MRFTEARDGRARQLTADNPKSLHLRVSGFVAILASVVATLVLSAQFAGDDWLTRRSASELALLALLSWLVANLFCVGLFLLLSGLRYQSFNEVWARSRGLLLKLAGANILLALLAAVSLDDSQNFVDRLEGRVSDWVFIAIIFPPLVLLVILAKRAVQSLRRGWSVDAPSMQTVLGQDPRRPVLYIRSFKDDTFSSGWIYTRAVSVEQEIVSIMGRIGPVIAIGRPGEALPELGAARLYVDDEEWKAKVVDMMLGASAVVVLAGTTANLWWEVEQAARFLPPERLIIVCPGMAWTGPFAEGFDQRFGVPDLPELLPHRLLNGHLSVRRRLMGLIVYFSKDSVAHAVHMEQNLLGYVVSPVRPYFGSLTSGLQRVFGQLGLPWSVQKSRTTAVLMALFGGGIGLQHFYLGYRRRGVLSVLFFWTCVPIFWGIVDFVRLALVHGDDFDGKFVHAGA
ncbi:MAG: TM2 domain-containing protein [Acidimicrobiales bacterium]